MKFINKIEINSPPQQVFYWLSDPDRAKQWMKSVVETEIISQTPEMTGTTFREVIEENGRRTELFGEITSFKQDEMLSFYLHGKFNTAKVNFALKKSGKDSILTQTAEIRFKSFMTILSILLHPILKKKIIRQSMREFKKLKELCEKDGAEQYE